MKNLISNKEHHFNLPIAIIFVFALLIFQFTITPTFAFDWPFGYKKPKVYTPESQYKHEQKVLRQEEKEKYEKSLLPESGFMTKEEYEAKSQDISNQDREVPDYKQPAKDPNMKFVPQYTYKIVYYNSPPGSPELHIGTDLKLSKKFIFAGVTSPDKSFLVYPALYYSSNKECTSGNLYRVPLDKTLDVLDRIRKANIVKRDPDAILSTQNTVEERCIFRSMTPIDFSTDGKMILAKEKIGSSQDGIWQTNLWVYNFDTKQSRELPEIREAIKYYWLTNENLTLDEKRWDIFPLGFDANNPSRVVAYALGYTGGTPKFLGTWSIDTDGTQSRLESLYEEKAQISENGFKVVKDGCVDPATVFNQAKRQAKLDKKQKKADKKAKKKERRAKKKAYLKKIRQMKAEERAVLRQYRKIRNPSYITN